MIVGVGSGVAHAIGSAMKKDGVAAGDDPGFVAILAVAEEVLGVFEGAWLIGAVTPIGCVDPAGALLAISAIRADEPGVSERRCGRRDD